MTDQARLNPIDILQRATRESGAWDDTPHQINIGSVNPVPLQAFRALAWLLRDSQAGLLQRLVEEEVEYLATHTRMFERQPRVPAKVKRIARPEGNEDLDMLADQVTLVSEEMNSAE
jgi:hypothetical protein